MSGGDDGEHDDMSAKPCERFKGHADCELHQQVGPGDYPNYFGTIYCRTHPDETCTGKDKGHCSRHGCDWPVEGECPAAMAGNVTT